MRTRKQCVPGLGGGGPGDEAYPQLLPITVNTAVWLMGIVENMHNIYMQTKPGTDSLYRGRKSVS